LIVTAVDVAIAPVASFPYAYRKARDAIMIFGYHIVPRGGHAGQAFDRGSVKAPDVEAARRIVQTVAAQNVAGKSGLEVILQDSGGSEIWRGPYLGASANA
jgi:hypothetical protein